MAWGGIVVKRSGDRLVLTAALFDDVGAELVGGTTTLMLFELQNDGTFKSYDFNDNTFKTTALTTATLTLTHRTGNNATQNTGVWTAALTTVSGLTIGNTYLVRVLNTNAYPTTQKQWFQYGGADGDSLLPTSTVAADGSNTANTFKTNLTESTTDYWKNPLLLFVTGSLTGQVQRVSAYNGSTKFITVSAAFTAAPSSADRFFLINQ